MSPAECSCLSDLLSMQSTCKVFSSIHMMIQHDQAVVITHQKRGEPDQASITIPKHIFMQFLEWYDGDQEPSKRTEAKRQIARLGEIKSRPHYHGIGRALAKEFSVSQSTIGRIRKGTSWA